MPPSTSIKPLKSRVKLVVLPEVTTSWPSPLIDVLTALPPEETNSVPKRLTLTWSSLCTVAADQSVGLLASANVSFGARHWGTRMAVKGALWSEG